MTENAPQPENDSGGELPFQPPTEDELEQIFKLTDQFSQLQAEERVLGPDRAKAYRESLGESGVETEEYAQVEGHPVIRPINSSNSSRKRQTTIDRRRLGPRGKIIADKGPNEVQEEIDRLQSEPLTTEERLMGAEQARAMLEKIPPRKPDPQPTDLP